MKTFLTICTTLLMSCFAMFAQAEPRPFAGPELLLEQGKFSEAREAYRRIADAGKDPSVREEAVYRAARVLVSSRNPSRDYALASRELETYLRQYPSGAFAEEASAWRAAIETVAAGQSRADALREQVDDLSKRSEALTDELQKRQAERDAALREQNALLNERDRLTRDKTSLEKKIAALAKEKERLSAAKARLEQRLRDVTAVDVKMERERKKMK